MSVFDVTTLAQLKQVFQLPASIVMVYKVGCPACHAAEQPFQQLAAMLSERAKRSDLNLKQIPLAARVNVALSMPLFTKMNVTSVPTFFLISKGKTMDQCAGWDNAELKKFYAAALALQAAEEKVYDLDAVADQWADDNDDGNDQDAAEQDTDPNQ